MKKFLLALLAVVLMFTTININNSVYADSPKVDFTKTVKPVEGKVNTWQIELKFEAEDGVKPADYVIVVDRSTSMNQKSADSTRLKLAKDATTELIEKIQEHSSSDPAKADRISLLSFSSEVRVSGVEHYGANDLTIHTELLKANNPTNIQTLKNELNSIQAKGGTFTQKALHEAAKIIENNDDPTRRQVIILITDGLPTVGTGIDFSEAEIAGDLWETGKPGLYQKANPPYEYIDVEKDSFKTAYKSYDNKYYAKKNGNGKVYEIIYRSGKWYYKDYPTYRIYSSQFKMIVRTKEFPKNRPSSISTGTKLSGANAFDTSSNIKENHFLYNNEDKRIGYGYKRYVWYEEKNNKTYYVDLVNSLVAEMKNILGHNKVDDIFFIAHDVGSDLTDPVAEVIGKGHTFNVRGHQLKNAIREIMAKTFSAPHNVVGITDPMGNNVQLVDDSWVGVGGENDPEKEAGSETLKWQIGTPQIITIPALSTKPKKRSAILTYQVTLKENVDAAALNGTPIKTNGTTTVKYTKPDGTTTTDTIPDAQLPSVKLSVANIEKEVYKKKAGTSPVEYEIDHDANNPINNKYKFKLKITGAHGFEKIIDDVNGNIELKTADLTELGGYVIEELDFEENPVKAYKPEFYTFVGTSKPAKPTSANLNGWAKKNSFSLSKPPMQTSPILVEPQEHVYIYVKNIPVLFGERYKFVSEDPSRTLPAQVLNLLPAVKTELYEDGELVTPSIDYSFEDKNDVTKAGKLNGYDPSKQGYDPNTEAVDDTKNIMIVDSVDGTGKWVFKGYKDLNAGEKQVDKKDVEFVGVWDFVPNNYKVTHEFVSLMPNKHALPDKLFEMTPLDKAQEDGANIIDGKLVKPDLNKKGTATPLSDYNNTHPYEQHKDPNDITSPVIAKWEFLGYKEYKIDSHGKAVPIDNSGNPTEDSGQLVNDPSQVINGKDAHFVGVWKCTENKPHKAVHEYISADLSRTLPKALKVDRKPKDRLTNDSHKELYKGVKVKPDNTFDDSAYIEYDTNGHKIGTWTFVGYKKDNSVGVDPINLSTTLNEVEKTVTDDDVQFIGVWKFTEEHKYKAKHIFKAIGTDKELPDDVKNLLPADRVKNDAGEPLTNTKIVTPIQPTLTTFDDSVNDGTWTFGGYKKHQINSTTGKIELLNGASVVNPETATATGITEQANATINNKDVEFVGVWEFTPKTYPVKHTFIAVDEDGSEIAGDPLPAEIKNYTDGSPAGLCPVDTNTATNGETVAPVQPTRTTVAGNLNGADGTWVFVDYDEPSYTINKGEVLFTGMWKFVPNKYKATYEFKSDANAPTNSKPLPAEVKAFLPNTKNDLLHTQEVSAEDAPTLVTNTTSIDVGDDKWTFMGWEDDKLTVNNGDIKFVGTWKLQPGVNATHNVSYEFKSGTGGVYLPEALKKQAPATQKNNANASDVIVTMPIKTYDMPDGSGTWSLDTYVVSTSTNANVMPDNSTISNITKDEHVIGTWTFTPKEYQVIHKFTGVDDKGNTVDFTNLPQKVKDELPASQIGKHHGDPVSPTSPSKSEVPVDGGKWVFEGYEPDDAVIDDEDVTFTGTWKFVPDYKVTYEYVSITEGKTLPATLEKKKPADKDELASGTLLDLSTPSVTEEEATEYEGVDGVDKHAVGIWKFIEYKEVDGGLKDVDTSVEQKIVDKDRDFVGQWQFEPYHKATHEFESSDSNIALPDEIKTRIPNEIKKDSNDKPLISGTIVRPNPPTDSGKFIEQDADGNDIREWTFTGYKDLTNGTKTVADKDLEFIGVWEPKDIRKYEATYIYISDNDKELPYELKLGRTPATVSVGSNTGADKHKLEDGSIVTPNNPTPTTHLTDANGKWVFKGYEDESGNLIANKNPAKTINAKNIEFVGVWTYIRKEYRVSYQFINSDDADYKYQDKTLPAAINNLNITMNIANLHPNTHSEDTVDAQPVKLNNAIPNFNGSGNNWTYHDPMDDNGKWVFNGYNENQIRIDNKDGKFVGEWKYVPKHYTVEHEFIYDNNGSGRTPPSTVTNQLPITENDHILWDKTANAKYPTNENVEVIEHGKVVGHWQFTGYYENASSNTKKDTFNTDNTMNEQIAPLYKFVGKWQYVEKPVTEAKVKHQYISDSAKPLDPIIQALVPGDYSEKIGEKVYPTYPEPEDKELKVSDGVWNFIKYVKSEDTLTIADVTFTGIWHFTPNNTGGGSHHSGGGGGSSSDEDEDDEDEDTPAEKPEEPKKEEPAKVEPAVEVVDHADPSKPVDPTVPKYEVKTTFVSGTPGKELPPEVLAIVTKLHINLNDGDSVDSDLLTITEIKVPQGKWVFKKFDRDNITINGASDEFIGTWIFILDEEIARGLPQTGDGLNPKHFAYILSIIALAFIGLGFVFRKREKE